MTPASSEPRETSRTVESPSPETPAKNRRGDAGDGSLDARVRAVLDGDPRPASSEPESGGSVSVRGADVAASGASVRSGSLGADADAFAGAEIDADTERACHAALDLLAAVPMESGKELGELIDERRVASDNRRAEGTDAVPTRYQRPASSEPDGVCPPEATASTESRPGRSSGSLGAEAAPAQERCAKLAELRAITETLVTGGYDGTEGEDGSRDTTWTDFGIACGIAEYFATRAAAAVPADTQADAALIREVLDYASSRAGATTDAYAALDRLVAALPGAAE